MANVRTRALEREDGTVCSTEKLGPQHIRATWKRHRSSSLSDTLEIKFDFDAGTLDIVETIDNGVPDEWNLDAEDLAMLGFGKPVTLEVIDPDEGLNEPRLDLATNDELTAETLLRQKAGKFIGVSGDYRRIDDES